MPSSRASSRSSSRASSPRRWRSRRWRPSRAPTSRTTTASSCRPTIVRSSRPTSRRCARSFSDYLLEHARAEGLALTSRPAVEFMTDERLALGEFGIQAQLLSPPEEEQAPARRHRAVAGRLRPHDGLLAGSLGRACAGAGASSARQRQPRCAGRRRPPHGDRGRSVHDRSQPRLRSGDRRPEHLAPPRRAAAPTATPGGSPTSARPTASRSTGAVSTMGCCAAATGSRSA